MPVHAPRHQYGEHPIAPVDRAPDDLAVVRRSRNDADALLEGVELADALSPAYPDNLVAPIQRVLHHVLPELPGGSDNADLRSVDVHPFRLVGTPCRYKSGGHSRTLAQRSARARRARQFVLLARAVGPSVWGSVRNRRRAG